jgi:diguanylate cyclase (GGDEF)-like protein/PAS domain S-box-containing protein
MPSQTTEFEDLLEAVPDALVGVDRSGVIRLVNRQAESMFGYERADLVGALIEMLVPQSFQNVHTKHRESYNPAPRTRHIGTDLRLSARRADGTEFPVDIALSPMNTADGPLVIAAVRDMTRYRAAEADRRRLDLLSAVVESSGEAIIGSTLDGIITSWNRAAERLFGYKSQEITGKYLGFLSPKDQPDHAATILSKVRLGQSVENSETLCEGKDVALFAASLTVSPIRDADDLVVGASTIARSVRALREASEAAQLMAAVVEHSDEAIITSKLDGIITSWNPAAERLFGYSRAEMVGKLGDHLSPGDRTQEIRDILARIGAGESGERHESKRVRRDGTAFSVSLTISPIRGKDGAVIGASTITRDMTQQHALKSAQHLAAIVEHSTDAINSSTLDGIITSWNPAAERLYGYSSDEIVGKSISLLSPKNRTGELEASLATVIASQHAGTFASMRVRKDGTVFPVSLTISPVRDADGTVIGASTIARDLTEQKEAVELSRSMIEASLDSMVSIGPDGTLTGVNEATVKLTGVPRKELLGTSFCDYFTDPEKANQIYQQVITEKVAMDTPLTVRHRNGALSEVLYNASVYRDAAGTVLGVFAAARDVTEQLQTQRDRLSRLADLRAHEATTDPLTGLPNRQALYTEGPVFLVKKRGQRRALLLLDLDKFKEVNDSLGHDAGDRLLVEVATRLRDGVRAGDLLARLGGDEFAVLLQDAGHEEATAVAVKLQAALAERFVLNGMALHSAVSVGIALFPAAGHDLSALLRKADIAMYKAKTASDGIHVYGSFDDNDGAARLRTVDELRTAMTSDQLVLHYQPKINLDTGDVHGVEALVRWDHPTRGLLYPDAFLALVEASGLMRALTRLVLEMALDQAAVWQARGQELTVAVNLSASSLVDADLPEQIAAMLAARGVPPRALQLEITEEFLMADRDRARNILTLLRESGVQISVDDFGTGYSSLSYLRELPVDELKLDQSFVFPMADDARAAALVASTIALAHSLGLRMVAEGVENDIAYTELTRLGCDQAQGYFISRPMPAAELDHWLSNRRAAHQATGMLRPFPSTTFG